MTIVASFSDLEVSADQPGSGGAVAVTFGSRRRWREVSFRAGPVPDTAREDRRAGCAAQLLDLQTRSQLARDRELVVGIRPMEGGVFSNWAAPNSRRATRLPVMPPDGRFV